jgi:hypothetical protein
MFWLLIPSDFVISFNRVLDTAGLGLGEKVKITGEIKLKKQESAENK